MKKDRKEEEERVKIDDCHLLSLKYARTLAVLCTKTKEHTTPYINCGDTLPKIVTATCQIIETWYYNFIQVAKVCKTRKTT